MHGPESLAEVGRWPMLGGMYDQAPGMPGPGGSDRPAWLYVADPDGNRIMLHPRKDGSFG